jgi:hypothetical protein
MKTLAWLVIAGCVIAIPIVFWITLRRHAARRRESEQRGAALVAEAARALAAKARADSQTRDPAKGQNSA